MNALQVEIAVANLYNYRANIIVPNVSWGWLLKHEADLIVVNKNNIVTEVEIKVTLSDLKADFKKRHNHESKNIHRLVYAIPFAMLEKALPLIPDHCGIITVNEVERHDLKYYVANHYRLPKKNRNLPITDKQLQDLMRLAVMRIWTLKQHRKK